MLKAAALTLVAAALVAGCGASARSPAVSSLPLVHGTTIVQQLRRCNPGANAYCAIAMVVVGPHYDSSGALVQAERNLLRAEGWLGTQPQTGHEKADESPHNALRVTYATAPTDLQGIELGYIQRPWPIAYTLANEIFRRKPTMSVLLQIGSQ